MVFLREPLERLSMNEQMGDNLYKSEQKFNTILYALMLKPFLAENGTCLAYSCSSAGESYG